jgi:hypothetical protein
MISNPLEEGKPKPQEGVRLELKEGSSWNDGIVPLNRVCPPIHAIIGHQRTRGGQEKIVAGGEGVEPSQSEPE